MFVKLTDAETGEVLYINPANVRLIRTPDPNYDRRHGYGTVRIQFDRDHAITVSERITDVLKALGDG